MKSLLRIVKEQAEDQKIQPYDFFAGFKINPSDEAEKPEDEEPENEEPFSGEEILKEARLQAERILADAREQAEILREQAYSEGKEEGQKDGFREAYEEQRKLLDEEIRTLQRNAADVIQSVSIEKDAILERYIDDLKRISLAVAEKIVQTSLQSSGDIIKRMILSATDKMTKKQWAKIYITKCNTGIAMDVDADFLEALSSLSDNIKLVTMDNGEEGTCIIELPMRL